MVSKNFRSLLVILTIILSIVILSCRTNKLGFNGKFVFKDSITPKSNYILGYNLLSIDGELVASGDVKLDIFSSFTIPIHEDSEYLQLHIKRVKRNPGDNTDSFLPGFDKLIELNDLDEEYNVFYITTSIEIVRPNNKLVFENFEDIKLKWKKKEYIDYYLLEIFNTDNTEFFLGILIPHIHNEFTASDIKDFGKPLLDIIELSEEDQLFIIKEEIEKIKQGTFQVEISGYKYDSEEGHLFQTVLSSDILTFTVKD